MIMSYLGISPRVSPFTFVAESSDIIGRVTIGEDSSIWFGAVLRGDTESIEVGKSTNIQDNTVIHGEEEFPVMIGDGVTVGHSCIIHGATVGDNTLIGMGTTLMDGCSIGKNTIIGAGALVPQGKSIPEGVLAMGVPAKVVRDLTEDEIVAIAHSAIGYVEKSKNYIR